MLFQGARIERPRAHRVKRVDPVVGGHFLPETIPFNPAPVARNDDRDVHVTLGAPQGYRQMVVVDQVVLGAVSDDHGDGARQQVVRQLVAASALHSGDLGVDLVHTYGILGGAQLAELETPDRALRAVGFDLGEKATYIVIFVGHRLLLVGWGNEREDAWVSRQSAPAS